MFASTNQGPAVAIESHRRQVFVSELFTDLPGASKHLGCCLDFPAACGANSFRNQQIPLLRAVVLPFEQPTGACQPAVRLCLLAFVERDESQPECEARCAANVPGVKMRFMNTREELESVGFISAEVGSDG